MEQHFVEQPVSVQPAEPYAIDPVNIEPEFVELGIT
jgi:hypothetical protein